MATKEKHKQRSQRKHMADIAQGTAFVRSSAYKMAKKNEQKGIRQAIAERIKKIFSKKGDK